MDSSEGNAKRARYQGSRDFNKGRQERFQSKSAIKQKPSDGIWLTGDSGSF